MQKQKAAIAFPKTGLTLIAARYCEESNLLCFLASVSNF